MSINTCCVILNYNDRETTCEQLNRLQENEAIDKIPVVDNCSTDNSRAEIEKHLTDKTEFLRSEKNGGYGAGNNIGIRRAAEPGARFIIIIIFAHVIRFLRLKRFWISCCITLRGLSFSFSLSKKMLNNEAVIWKK